MYLGTQIMNNSGISGIFLFANVLVNPERSVKPWLELLVLWHRNPSRIPENNIPAVLLGYKRTVNHHGVQTIKQEPTQKCWPRMQVHNHGYQGVADYYSQHKVSGSNFSPRCAIAGAGKLLFQRGMEQEAYLNFGLCCWDIQKPRKPCLVTLNWCLVTFKHFRMCDAGVYAV